MSFAQDTGYTPRDITALMNAIREGINTQFSTSYTEESFVGTNWYKYFYALIQDVQKNEVKTSEIFAKLTQYISDTNLRIQRPSVSLPGIIESFASKGYVASVKPAATEDAGNISICVDVDETALTYPATRLDICTHIKNFVVGNLVCLGTEVESITLPNGQSFDFKFFLPDRTPILLRLTIVTSENNLLLVPSDEEIRQLVFDQTKARYRLGLNFEPQRYFTPEDAPYAAEVTLEYSTNAGSTWSDSVFDADFDDLYTFNLEDIQVLIDP